jgi:AmmeMemoRadiSam system protein B
MPWSLMVDGAYRTPLGDLPIDTACAEALRGRCPFLQPDPWSQRGEHAVEVLLPFLQLLGPAELSVVPILAGSDDLEEFMRLGTALAQVVRLQEEPVLLIASSDLAHYEPVERTRTQDAALLSAMCALDSEALRRYVQSEGILMCGYGAAISVIEAVRALGAREVEVSAHATSVEAGGDPGSAIGYGGVILR